MKIKTKEHNAIVEKKVTVVRELEKDDEAFASDWQPDADKTVVKFEGSELEVVVARRTIVNDDGSPLPPKAQGSPPPHSSAGGNKPPTPPPGQQKPEPKK